ncbi:MAG: GNAT family protein [Dermatophilaceae bacterium]
MLPGRHRSAPRGPLAAQADPDGGSRDPAAARRRRRRGHGCCPRRPRALAAHGFGDLDGGGRGGLHTGRGLPRLVRHTPRAARSARPGHRRAGHGDLVGEIVLNERDASARACNLRILVGAAGRGRGLGTEAVRLLTAYGLDVLELHRISLEVHAFNARARHVYEKVGFVHEGTLRQALSFDGDWVDTHVMAILAGDPRG